MTTTITELHPTVLIIGGGPSGLRAAAELAGRVEGEVLVLERESIAGGIPRHSDHPGYGMRDLHKFIGGPRYAEILRKNAVRAGVLIMENAMVTDWAGDAATVARGGRAIATGDARLHAEAVRVLSG